MKKISSRAISVLLIALVVLSGLGYFVYTDYNNGRSWALYFPSYNSGSEGRIIDRNGVELASFTGAKSTFSEDENRRIANYHVTGDYWGRTGTGVLSRYWKSSLNYDFITGTTQAEKTTLHLTIDSNLNNKAYEYLKKNGKGCVMISNYRTGEVLAMVSNPSADPLNNGEEGVEDGAYINRCLSSAFIPGSTFKLVTSVAAIENIPDIYERTFTCEEKYDIAGVTIKCTVPHGTQTFEEALANSCNCAFAQITVMLGQDTMVDYVRKFGFLDPHDLDGIPSVAGNYPTEFVGDPELAWSGIGQSIDQVCPYTMLRYVSAIANDGSLVEMQLAMREDGSVPETTSLVNPSTAKKMQKAMRNNVLTHYEGNVNFPGLNLCAKTGTAENAGGEDHSWFVGFLQDDAHPYAFVSFVENGGFGLWTAGMMMNDILQYAVNAT